VTQTPVATIVRSHSYNRLPWLRFADNITVGVSNVSIATNTVVPIIITVDQPRGLVVRVTDY
jgi:hypothetical protein